MIVLFFKFFFITTDTHIDLYYYSLASIHFFKISVACYFPLLLDTRLQKKSYTWNVILSTSLLNVKKAFLH